MVIVSLTSNRTQSQAEKLLTEDSYLEDNVFSGELREHWFWKRVQEKGILSVEMHPYAEVSQCTPVY